MMQRTWSDGHSSVEQCGEWVTVQIMCDVYPSRYSSESEAATVFEAEVAAAMMTVECGGDDGDGLTWEQWRYGQ